MMRWKTIQLVLVIVAVSSIIIGYNLMSKSEAITSLLPSSENSLTGPVQEEVQRLQECLERSKDEYEKHKSEAILDSTIWNDVKYMLFFFGHGSSGTTLVGALLDAHPNIIIAHEYDVPGKWTGLKKKEQTRDYLFQALFTNSYGQSKFGRRQENCPRIRSMNVPNQWQGKFDKRIKIIGDKKAERFTSQIALSESNKEHENTLRNIQEALKVPFKFIYMVRNPFDIAATKMHRKAVESSVSERLQLYDKTSKYNKTRQIEVVKRLATVIKGAVEYTHQLGDQVIVVYSEDMIDNPTRELKRLCKFLDVSCSKDYLKDCSSIVFKSPSKTRNSIIWSEEAKNIINKLLREVPLLKRYSFDD